MHLVASVSSSTCLIAHLLALLFGPFDVWQVWSKEESLPVQDVCLCVSNQWAYVDNYADAVNQLLILSLTSVFQMIAVHPAPALALQPSPAHWTVSKHL